MKENRKKKLSALFEAESNEYKKRDPPAKPAVLHIRA